MQLRTLFIATCGLVLATPAVADALDQGYCYCAANFWFNPDAPRTWFGQQIPYNNMFVEYVHYYSEVHRRDYSYLWKAQDSNEAREPLNAWRAGARNYHDKYTVHKFDDGVVLGNSRWRYRFNKDVERLLPGWGKNGKEIDTEVKTKEIIYDCTDWCRLGWPHLKDITSMCNKTAPSINWVYNAVEEEFLQLLPTQPRGDPSHLKNCWLYHYKDLLSAE